MANYWRTQMHDAASALPIADDATDGAVVIDLATFLRAPAHWLAMSKERVVQVLNGRDDVTASYFKGESLVFLSALNAPGAMGSGEPIMSGSEPADTWGKLYA